MTKPPLRRLSRATKEHELAAIDIQAERLICPNKKSPSLSTRGGINKFINPPPGFAIAYACILAMDQTAVLRLE